MSAAQRLAQVDALRGLAALAVVLFHYTTKFHEFFLPGVEPVWELADGHLGVNLFFIISGFVIFMTLERTTRPMDFVVSRFSRLFPAYWAAVVLTFTVVAWLGLPGKEQGLGTALLNLLMIHGLFGVPHVDGVYWTLEIEMLFYAGMLLLFVRGGLARVHLALWALMGLQALYLLMARLWGIDLPWKVSHWLILKYIAWFAMGIAIYQVACRGAGWRGQAGVTLGLALGLIAALHGPKLLLLAALFAAATYGAARGRLPWLEWRFLTWLGAISYPLYLLHENIGWALQRRLVLDWGWTPMQTLAPLLVISLLLAWALHRSVELPAMRCLRDAYRRALPLPLKA